MGYTSRSQRAAQVCVALAHIVLVACGGDPEPAADGGVDAGAPVACSSDTQCDDSVFCNGVELCDPTAAAADERGCVDAANPACLAGQTCEEASARCVTMCSLTGDADGDGELSIECGGRDCDDSDPSAYPGRTEVCDREGHDEDCDPATFGVRDADVDGYPDAVCCNGTGDDRTCGTDCDDTLSIVHPTEAESCDGLDNDCDDAIDELVLVTYTVDADGDGHGSSAADASTVMQCTRPDGYSALADDCDDTTSAVHPGLPEICDPAVPPSDENCDEIANPASLCDCGTGDMRSCASPGVCSAGTETCIDGHWGTCSVASVAETCNGLDDDCDGTIDEMRTVHCYADADNDGYASPSAAESDRCPDASRAAVGGCPANTTNVAPVGAGSFDCDDALATVRPSAFETCNDRDDDCDSTVDETVAVTCFADVDGDTYPPGGATASSECPVSGRGFVGGCPTGFTNRAPADGSDCNDASTAINPVATEVCDYAIDHDCDAIPDAMDGCTCMNGATRSCPLPGVCAAGSQTCVTGAWSACSIMPTPEVCNGLNDDCDASGADETFACVRGATSSCSVCGRTGSQACRSDCTGYETCRAADEECNGCDDDVDGTVDDGFFCRQGATGVPCTTPCGTPGTGTCDGTCGGVIAGTCRAAAESCNYCDDDGDGSTYDEEGLASTMRGYTPQCSQLTMYSGATCTMVGVPSQDNVTLLTGAASDVAAAWISGPEGVGFGPMSFDIQVQATRGTSPPADGWAFVLARGGSGFVGGIGGAVGVPMTRIGLAFEWRYYQNDPNADQPDYLTIRRLTGSSPGTVLATVMIPEATSHLNGGSSPASVIQTLRIEYVPAGTSGSPVETLTVRPYQTGTPFVRLAGPGTLPLGYSPGLMNELPSGSPLSLGMTAASGGRTASVVWRTGLGPSPGPGRRSYFEWAEACF